MKTEHATETNPAMVVYQAITSVLLEVERIRATSLCAALLADELLERGCEIAGVRRIDIEPDRAAS